MTGPGFGLERIGQVAVPVHDLDRAVAFYREALGMRLEYTAETMAFVDCGGVTLMLAVPERPEFDHPSSIIYFRVDDIHAAYQTLQERDVRFKAGPRLIHRGVAHGLYMALFWDADANLLALTSEVPRHPSA